MIATRLPISGFLVACWLNLLAAGCSKDSSQQDAGTRADAARGSKSSGDGGKHTSRGSEAVTPDAASDSSLPDAMAMKTPTGSPTFGAVFDEVITTGGGCNNGPLCHGGSAGMLRMSDRASAYAALVSVPAKGMNLADTTGANCADTGLVRVVPGDPKASLLMQKIDPPAGKLPCGGIMPPTGMLKPAQIEQIRTWIENGAKDD